MKYKGHDMELVEVRWWNYWPKMHISTWNKDAILKGVNSKQTVVCLGDDITVEEGQVKRLSRPFATSDLFQRDSWGYAPRLDFSIYSFSIMSTLDRSILREALEEHHALDTFGAETIFWDRLLQCKTMTKESDHFGIFITAWAVNTEIIHHRDESEDHWELIGVVNPDLSITEVGYSWGHKVEDYERYVMQAMCQDPRFGLHEYLTGFDFPSIGGW